MKQKAGSGSPTSFHKCLEARGVLLSPTCKGQIDVPFSRTGGKWVEKTLRATQAE